MRRAATTVAGLVLVSSTLAAPLPAQTPRRLLTGQLDERELSAHLVSRERWHPYPTIDERAGWAVVPEKIRTAYVAEARRQVGAPWEPLPARAFLEFSRDGNRSRFEALQSARRRRLESLVLGELFENEGRFLDDIADGVWAICEESYWGRPAHLYLQKRGPGLPDVTEPTVDLLAAETGSLLSWTVYLLGDRLARVSPLLPERVRAEVDRRILRPNLERDDFWWMGFGRRKLNNWNPWVNSNWLTAVLLLEDDPTRRSAAVYKILRSLDNFLDTYPEDGGCDEGPGYWNRAGGSLFDCLELLSSATGGRIDLYRQPLVGRMGQYIAKAYISGDYFINFADASARLRPSGELIYRFGRRIQDPALAAFGAFHSRRSGLLSGAVEAGSLGRSLPALLSLPELQEADAAEPLIAEFWLPDVQIMGARLRPGSVAGLYLAAKGGHNAESHNHNDVGHFIVYLDGLPLLVDIGPEAYTARTFSPRRYEIWTMQSAYHNLPTINGVLQKEGAEHRARDVRFSADPAGVRFSLDIAPAYPREARVTTWRRELTLDRRRHRVELAEEYVLEACTDPFRLSLMTPLEADVSRAGEVSLGGSGEGARRRAVIRFDRAALRAAAEPIALTDSRLRSTWGERLTRIVLTSTGCALRGRHRIVVQPGP